MKRRAIWMVISAMAASAACMTAAHAEGRDYLAEATKAYEAFKSAAKDITLVQKLEVTTPDGIVTEDATTLQKGIKLRVNAKAKPSQDAPLPENFSAESAVIADGSSVWMVTPSAGKRELSYQEGKQYLRDTNFWDDVVQNGKMTGEEMLGNYDCILLQSTDETGTVYTLWVEKDNWNLIQAESHPQDTGKVNFWNSDFRKIDGGWEIPFKQEVYVDGQLMLTSYVKSAQINQDLGDDLFDPDKVTFEGSHEGDVNIVPEEGYPPTD